MPGRMRKTARAVSSARSFAPSPRVRMKNDSIPPGIRPTTKSTAISGRNTPRPNARMRNMARRPAPPASTPAPNRYHGSRRMNAQRRFHPSATCGLRRGARLNLCPKPQSATNPLFSPRRVGELHGCAAEYASPSRTADRPHGFVDDAPDRRRDERAREISLTARCGRRGAHMTAERQKIRAAEWLHRWNLSMRILGIGFTILTFVGVFTLVLRNFFEGIGLTEFEVLFILLAVVLTVIFGFGFYLDKFLRFWSAQTTVATVRNQFLTSALYQKELLIMKYSQVPQMEGLLHLVEALPDSPAKAQLVEHFRDSLRKLRQTIESKEWQVAPEERTY